MKTVWTKGLSVQDKHEIEAGFAACAQVRQRLETLINEKVKTKRKEVVGVDAYQSPAWAYLQADAIGYERAMKEIISLISSSSVEKD